MDDPWFSVVIPYSQRLPQLTGALTSLAEQTLNSADFEVVIGAIGYDQQFISTCEALADQLAIVTVMVSGEWNCSRARNSALRQARGRVVVLLDADMAVPTTFLANLRDQHFAHDRNHCVLGQIVGYYDESGDVRFLEGAPPPYEHYRAALADLQANEPFRVDRRLSHPVLPWAMSWSGLVALPLATIREHDLYFDERFRGWGWEDVEWGYRVWRTGTPITIQEDVYGLHQPHQSASSDSRANRRYLLKKWPALEVEMWSAFGSAETIAGLDDLTREVTAIVGDDHTFGVLRGTVDGAAALIVGVVLNSRREPVDPDSLSLFDDGLDEVHPLVGMTLPYLDGDVERCLLLPPVRRLSPRYREAILREARRVARRAPETPQYATASPADDGHGR